MPKFKNREEYERWKAERMQGEAQTPPEIISDVPEVKKKKSSVYIVLVALVVMAISIFVIYKQFFQPEETWTESSYTNWKLGFSMDIPEGWGKYDFTRQEKAMIEMESLAAGGKVEILFTLTPNNRRDIGYSMIYLDMKGMDTNRMAGNSDVAINSLASALSDQGFKAERIEKSIAGMDIPFVRANQRKIIFIFGTFSLSPEKIFVVQFIDNSGEFEEEFWRSIGSFELIEG